MEVLNLGGNCIQIASDIYRPTDPEVIATRYKRYAFRFFSKTVKPVHAPETGSVAQLISRSLGRLTPYAFLDAHGFVKDGVWHCNDGDKNFPLQDWIDQHDDGSYRTLIVFSCNVAKQEPKSENSALLYPKYMIDTPSHRFGFSTVQAYIPGIGTLIQQGW